MPSIFFVTTEERAETFTINHPFPPEDVFECSFMEPLKISMLWAILTHEEWQQEMVDLFPDVVETEDEAMVWRFPGHVIFESIGNTVLLLTTVPFISLDGQINNSRGNRLGFWIMKLTCSGS